MNLKLFCILLTFFRSTSAAGIWNTVVNPFGEASNDLILSYSLETQTATAVVTFPMKGIYIANLYSSSPALGIIHSPNQGPFSSFRSFLFSGEVQCCWVVDRLGTLWELNYAARQQKQPNQDSYSDVSSFVSSSSLPNPVWDPRNLSLLDSFPASELTLFREDQAITMLITTLDNVGLIAYDPFSRTTLRNVSLPSNVSCGSVTKSLVTTTQQGSSEQSITLFGTSLGCILYWENTIEQHSTAESKATVLSWNTSIPVIDMLIHRNGTSTSLVVLTGKVSLANSTAVRIFNLTSFLPQLVLNLTNWKAVSTCIIQATDERFSDLLYVGFQDGTLARINLTLVTKVKNPMDAVFIFASGSDNDSITTLAFNYGGLRVFGNNLTTSSSAFFPVIVIGYRSGIIKALLANSTWIILASKLAWVDSTQAVSEFKFFPDIDDFSSLVVLLSKGELSVLRQDIAFLYPTPSYEESQYSKQISQITPPFLFENMTLKTLSSLPVSFFVVKQCIQTQVRLTVTLMPYDKTDKRLLVVEILGFSEDSNPSIQTAPKLTIKILNKMMPSTKTLISYHNLFFFVYDSKPFLWTSTQYSTY